ncbi:MAG: valine--tRNA ligase, partial [Patescibacteria group bacterium]
MSDQKEMQKAYDAKSVEDDIYAAWEESGYFTPENLPDLEKRTESFSIVLPPPNVTGTLHIGHAVMLAIEDIMIRYARMRGKKALWLPGTDHAAIATQTKVEKLLIKEGMEDPRRELGREEFLKRVDKFAQDSHDTIVNQMKKMGTSVDWTREAFTLDDARNLAVRTQFKKMYDDGLIYRGNRVINWCPRCKSTLADDEVEHKEGTARLYTFTYDKDFPISISTTRPETKFGDTAVAVNPKDKRYKKFVGQELTANYCGNELKIKIIADDVVDMDFGTGALGVTPAHSNIDAEMARKHDLVSIQVIDEEGRMINSPEVEGMFAVAAREKAVVWLKENGLLQNEEDAPQNLSVCYRCDTPIEPLPKIQWFINVNKNFKFNQSKENPIDGIKDGQEVTLKELMQHVVRSKQIKIIPDRFDKTYFHWIDNLRDWNISRQLWYGHRVPVWYRTWQPDGDEYVMGFHERTVESIKDGGKTVTYRLRDHGVKEGDHFAFENSQAKVVFGYGTILKIEKTTVGLIPLADPAHGATYEKREQLIEAFQFHHPEMKVTEETPVWVYTYSFGPLTNNQVQETVVGVDAPKGKNWEQDPDTLDTWFSAGLWTFSTLGWPEQTIDLKTFHPTDVMETGYDILFFWVARMILMTTYALGEIPYKHVYLHGLVRDEKGRKMSKSLDNAIDPLDMINEYGADATRISLIIGSTPGNDTKMSED